MRMGQLQSLTPSELELLLYIVNVIEPTSPPISITPNLLCSFKHDMLLAKVARQESKMTPTGQYVFKGLMIKLSRHPYQDMIDNLNRVPNNQLELPLTYDNTSNHPFTQTEFHFCTS